ncbi:FMN-dependent NADH-azoreductase [Microbulbifer thermotolerans]|uniref:FMN dependent NADH:quinone oxidoreductase n=1 Tax=Microbulbifer thermotolerans TaxID=252514 RepID=A0A143HM16_MICTH|nr:FMN-dependent NADH-azoreductase [Microbulbifer thermotolerans]AMX02571.1 FMN-dependent NADH-azoreductase [Microbulbifer thermotolerans]MCX2779713.1 FMN-dependent NADH-azoreductase [Microbulbifer thermotolerans]MCX2782355.1 FMN-dependent NADH-azoreductase [Microbulbifer thermotolerans]MCX2794944.1 FMN-dependent NADH-azoreductase [Microbulbifer thermotolerans]MCX2800508.1 FMN-dependent NADH-azoreductase [Microbulbifer thermotolerans]
MTHREQKLLKIQTSLFQNDGVSSQLADEFARQWQAQNPQGQVITRDLGAEPVPHLDLARFQSFITPEEERTAEQKAVVNYSDQLIAEITSADVLVLGIPMYNFSVPSTLRAYFDHVARAGVTFRYTPEGPQGLIKGKRAVVFITRGGFHGEDHSQTAYVRQFLGFLGITDVEVVHAEGLSVSQDAKENSVKTAREKIAELV